MTPEDRAEANRIFELMTPVERQLYRKIGGSVPRDIIRIAPNWRCMSDPISPFKLSAGGPGATNTVRFEVNGEIICGLKAAAKAAGCFRSNLEKLRDSPRVINGVTVRRLTPYLTKKEQRKLKRCQRQKKHAA